jgi:hypothetical protein
VGEYGKLEFGRNFDETVPNEKIWIPGIHIVAAVQTIWIPKQFLAVLCISNVKKGFKTINHQIRPPREISYFSFFKDL